MECTWIALLLAFGLAQGQECGSKPTQRPAGGPGLQIVNGRNADRGAWPWQLSLRFNPNGTDEFRHTCGASLIDANWAMTAAHCVDPEIGGPERDNATNYRLIAGAHEMALGGSEQTLSIHHIIRHSRYVADSTIGFPNDIALLHLASAADLSPTNVGIACIPNNATHFFDNNPNCWISGWGLVDFWDGRLPTILQEGNVATLTNAQCEENFPFPRLRETHQCVGTGQDGTPGACQGDSGGPLHCLNPDDGRWYVSGVTSFGILGCEGAPSIYTRTAAYADWIKERINAPVA